MNRIAQIKQDIWSSQTIEQPLFRYPHAIDRLEVVYITGRFLVKQTISPGKPVLAQSALEMANVRLVNAPIFRCRQQFKPNGIQLQPPQPQHPLQWHGKNAASFAIFGGEAAAQENRHARRIAVLAARSSAARCAIRSLAAIARSEAVM